MSPANLELKNSPANRIETTLGLQLPVRGQISRCTQRQMHLFIEVFAELAIATPHFVGDMRGHERARLILKSLVLGRQCDVCEVHLVHLDHIDDESAETVHGLERMRQAVAGHG